MNKSLLDIKGYLAVIPKIQNIYPPERIEVGWQTGFKYDSGVFEFFSFKQKADAVKLYISIKESIENYYSRR